ncbi:hypothetical protein [Agaribacterium haliotis]|uniref:hypothetical protein n=1 Tax=Agaribacterium haliotis TaxID=2013869 RepID=UPI000BB589EF|nr:hypothetical protein [Agaribacterium haliotis]
MPAFQLSALCRTIVFSSAALLAACGGGGSDSSEPEPGGSTTPRPGFSGSPTPGSSPAPSLNALNEQRCSAIAEYEWLDERCYLIGNHAVANLQYIELLPAKDRQDLLSWLTKLEKKVAFREIFPNFSDSDSLGRIPDAQPVLALDNNLLLDRLDDAAVVKTDSGMVSISKLGLSDESYSQEVGVNVAIDQNVVENKRVQLRLGGGRMRLSLFGAEVYRFDMVDALFLQSHIASGREGDLSTRPSVKLQSRRETELDYASLAAGPLFELLTLHFAAAGDSVTAVQQKLALSQGYADAHIKLDGEQPKLAMQLQLGEQRSALLSNSRSDSGDTARPATAANLYFPKFALGTHLHQDSVSLALKLYLRPAQFSGAASSLITLPLELQLEEAEPLDDQIFVRNYSYKNPKFVQGGDAELHRLADSEALFDITMGMSERLDAMQDSADRRSYSSAQWRYFPSFTQWSSSFITIAEDEYQLPMAVLDDVSLQQQAINLAAPKHAGGAVPNRQEWNNSRHWADDLGWILGRAFEHDADSALSKLPTWLSSEQSHAAFTELSQHLSAVLEPLDDDLREIYVDYLLDFYIRMAYLGQLGSSQVPSPEQMLNALNQSGLEFFAAFQAQLLNLTNVRYSEPRQWLVDDDALSVVANISNILSDDNVALIKAHDNKAFAFSSVPALNLAVFRLYVDSDKDLELFAETMQKRSAAVSHLVSFIESDEPNKQDDYDFENGADDLAKRAYGELWSEQTYQDLVEVMSFAYDRSSSSNEPMCTAASVVENIYCTDRFNSKIFNLYSTNEGYLASYDNTKPYVENAKTLAEIHAAILEMDELKGHILFSVHSDYFRAIEDGLWLDCEAQQIVDNIGNSKTLIDQYLALVKLEPRPRLYSDAHEAQQAVEKAFVEQLKQCELVVMDANAS